MTKTIRCLAVLGMLLITVSAQADPPPDFSVGLTEKGNSIAGVASANAVGLTASVETERFNEAETVRVVFMWPEGAQNADGSYKTLRPVACEKIEAGGRVLWAANVNDLRGDILDTSQRLSFYFEATMPDGSKRYLQLAAGTFRNRRGVTRIDDSLPLTIDCPDERPDGTRALQILPRPRDKSTK